MKSGWTYRKLSDICLQITDGSHFSPKEDKNGKYPMLSVKDMDACGFNYSSCKYINEEDYKSLVANGCKPSRNDVLVAKDGSYLKTAFVQVEDIEQAILSSIAILKPKTNILSPYFLSYFFKAPHTKEVIEKYYLTGTAIKRVILKGFRALKIPVPSLDEQERIVAELDLLTDIIDKQKAQLKELDTLALSIFHDMFGNPVENEKRWTIKKLGDICTSDLGKTLNASKDTGEFRPYLCAVNIHWNDIDLSNLKQTKFEDDELERYSVRKGDLLVCEGGDIGRSAIWEEEYEIQYQNALHRLRFRGEMIPVFCLFVLQDMKSKGILDGRYAKGVTIKHLVKSSLLAIPMPIPPLYLQEAFAEKLLFIEQQKEFITHSIFETQMLFEFTMDKYFG